MSEWLSAAIYAPIGVIVTVLINWFKERHKDKSTVILQSLEGAEIVQGMSFKQLESYVAEIERLKTNTTSLEGQIRELRIEVDNLILECRKERRARLLAEDERDRVVAERDYYKALANR